MSRITVNTRNSKGTINKNIYGHFSEHLGRCIYQGLFVGHDSDIPNVNGMRTDVVEALRRIRVPVLRWPGGCFADEYHWKDGVGEQAGRKRMVNTHWGGVVEDNSFGTHEFMELCRQIGCEPYINGNMGSGTVQEMSEWVEYMTFDGISPMAAWRAENGRKEPWKVKYFAVGNENWGCGGNMRPEYYADEYRRYQTYLRNYGENRLYKVACGPNSDDYRWTEEVMRIAGRYMDGLSLHYYTVPYSWKERGGATVFGREMYYETLKRALHMETLVDNHLQIMRKYDPEHKVGLVVDEWGTWYDVEPGTNPGFLYQQNTMRDAIVAGLTLNIFNRHCDRVVMANLAQTVNVLQAVVLTEGNQMLLTPTYHVFDLYQAHQEASLADCFVETQPIGVGETMMPKISASASTKDGVLTVTVVNASDAEAEDLVIELSGVSAASVQGRVLSGAMDMYNDFGADGLHPRPLDGVTLANEGVCLTLPACSVAELTIR